MNDSISVDSDLLFSSTLGVNEIAAVTVRRLSEGTHRALKLRAAQHGRSTEAEIRAILEAAVHSDSSFSSFKIGSELAAFGRRHGGLDLDIDRDEAAAVPAVYE